MSDPITVAQIAADFAQYKTDVDTTIAAGKASLVVATDASAALQVALDAALAANGGIPAEVQTELDNVAKAITDADAALVTPPVVVPPVDQPPVE